MTRTNADRQHADAPDARRLRGCAPPAGQRAPRPASPRRSRSRFEDQFEAAAGGCGSLGELHALLDAAARELGFRYFALLHHASLRRSRPGLVRLDTYPPEWEAELRGRHRGAVDPVHLASTRSLAGFLWSDLGLLIRLSGEQRAVLAEGRSFGLGAGFTVPANIPGEPPGSCSFVARRGVDISRRRLLCAELVGLHAFGAARRLCGRPGAPAAPHLSRRERQCVRLVAAGKTDWEIAAILGLGVETVRSYVKRARAAYDVVSRAQLAAAGLRDALVSFDEAIPPSG